MKLLKNLTHYADSDRFAGAGCACKRFRDQEPISYVHTPSMYLCIYFIFLWMHNATTQGRHPYSRLGFCFASLCLLSLCTVQWWIDVQKWKKENKKIEGEMRAATVQGRAASAATTPLGSEMENYVKGGGRWSRKRQNMLSQPTIGVSYMLIHSSVSLSLADVSSVLAYSLFLCCLSDPSRRVWFPRCCIYYLTRLLRNASWHPMLRRRREPPLYQGGRGSSIDDYLSSIVMSWRACAPSTSYIVVA